MEIVIGMAIAFLIGAYIRKPFDLHFNKKPEPVQIVEEEHDGKITIEEQVSNLMNFNVKRKKHEN